MIISHSRQFTFVHIHKAGGTSVEQALDPFLAWNDLILGGSPLGERMQVPYQARFGLNKHSAVSEIEKVCGSRYTEEYFLFALVRHPVARVCSIYNFVATMLNRWADRQKIPLSQITAHITPKAAKKTPALLWPASRAFLASESFSEFIRHEKVKFAPGFRPQLSMLTSIDGEGPKGTIFRLEDYPEWATILGERLGIAFELPQANRSELRSFTSDPRPYLLGIAPISNNYSRPTTPHSTMRAGWRKKPSGLADFAQAHGEYRVTPYGLHEIHRIACRSSILQGARGFCVKIYVAGNCQASVLIDLLGPATGLPAEYLTRSDQAALETPRVIFAQSQCRGWLREPAIFFPRIVMPGFHPDQVQSRDNAGARSPLRAYCSSIVLKAWYERIPTHATITLFNAAVFERLGFFEFFEAGKAQLLKEGHAADFPLETFFARWLGEEASCTRSTIQKSG